jgi:histidinol dehydrogenase
MPCRELIYNGSADWPAIKAWLGGRALPDANAEERVRAILNEVRGRGDQALAEYTSRFDCPGFTAGMLRVSKEAIQAAAAAAPAEDLRIIEEAAANIRAYHQGQVQASTLSPRPDGSVLGRLVRPVDRVGLYVPGGQGGETPLISSLLMNAIPAQVAGVSEIAVVSPPRKDGTLNPYILATAALLGLDEIYCVGSAWAVAALAFGTGTIAPVDVIAGPGNIYVTTAKRLLIGSVGIDMIAGPSEIAIVAQASQEGFAAKPAWIAADMLSQAEHDPLAAALCITPSPALARTVRACLVEQLALLPRNEIAARALGEWGATILVPDLETAYELVNRIGPEHLELALADPWSALGLIRHAGAIFLGQHSPEPVGDYFAGPNHVLPTLGTARFSSGLSVENFCKKSSLIATSPGFIDAHAAKIGRFARLEGLEAHARSVECRRR